MLGKTAQDDFETQAPARSTAKNAGMRTRCVVLQERSAADC